MYSKFFKLTIVLIVFGLFTGLIYTNSAYSQNKGNKKTTEKETMAKGEEKPANPWDELKLTPEQKKSIFDLRTNLMKSVLPIKNSIGEKKAHLKTLSTIDNPDMNAINATIDDIAALKGQMMKLHIANRQEIRKLLTDKQRVIFDTKGHLGFGMKHHRKMHKGMEHGNKDGHDGDSNWQGNGNQPPMHHPMNQEHDGPGDE